MVYRFDGYNYLVRLDKGERLVESLERFAHETKLPGGWVSGIGGALEVELGFYDLDTKEYQYRRFEGLCEIVSLPGSLAFDESGRLIVHLHGVFGDKQYQTVGGHVKELVAGATVELFVHLSQLPVTRKLNDEVGLPLLDLSKGEA